MSAQFQSIAYVWKSRHFRVDTGQHCHSGQLHLAASACAMRIKLVKLYFRPFVEYKIFKESRTYSEFVSL